VKLVYSLTVLLLLACNGLAQESSASWFKDCGDHNHFTCDVTLVDQDGRSVKLYRDLLQGKIVVVQAIFTTCKESCPVMARRFAVLQDLLGDRVGKEVTLLSFSVDPETDTPERLKAYAAEMKAKAGWLFLTGKKDNVQWALHKLGQFVKQKEDHLTWFVVGNERAGYWEKVPGLQSPLKTMEAVQRAIRQVPEATPNAAAR